MARIAGVDLPKEKRVEIGLTYIYGIGVASSNKILAKAGVNPDTRVKDLTDEEVNSIRKVIDESYKVEGDLRREVALNIKRLSYSSKSPFALNSASSLQKGRKHSSTQRTLPALRQLSARRLTVSNAATLPVGLFG